MPQDDQEMYRQLQEHEGHRWPWYSLHNFSFLPLGEEIANL